jgi:NTP pyrophosphatase (non-canonical NTP hydrolase)
MMNSYLIGQVQEWGEDKGILPNPDPMAQWSKTDEEVLELREAIIDNNREEVIDAIGDIIVTLIMQCEAWDTNVTECLEQAYSTIRKRTGKMVDGVFVKDVV